jgi:uncharacterized protein (DUF2336 family)
VIVRRFLAWARIAPACARADATSALARAFLFAVMEPEERYEAEIALTVMLDDPSPLVHRALAEAIANAAEAPHHLITSLVALGGEAAALILGRTRLLSEAELVDAAAIGSERSQIAIACREELPATISAALAEIGSLGACTALLRNPTARPTEAALLRMLERFGMHAELREALLARSDLPARVRERLMGMVSFLLKSFIVERGWLNAERAEALARDAEQRGALALACDTRLELREIVACLKEGGRLTPAFVVHALLSGRIELVAATLADLGGTPQSRVAAFLRENRRAPLLALLKRAGIPHWLAPVFPIALAEMRKAAIEGADATASTPLRLALRRILERIDGMEGEQSPRLIAYLRGLEAEAARGEARALAEAMITLDDAEQAGASRAARKSSAAQGHGPAFERRGSEISSSDRLGSGSFGFAELETRPVDLDAVAVARAA